MASRAQPCAERSLYRSHRVPGLSKGGMESESGGPAAHQGHIYFHFVIIVVFTVILLLLLYLRLFEKQGRRQAVAGSCLDLGNKA